MVINNYYATIASAKSKCVSEIIFNKHSSIRQKKIALKTWALHMPATVYYEMLEHVYTLILHIRHDYNVQFNNLLVYILCFFYSSFRVIVLSYCNFIFSSVLVYVLYEIKEIIIIMVNVGNKYH